MHTIIHDIVMALPTALVYLSFVLLLIAFVHKMSPRKDPRPAPLDWKHEIDLK